jgi:predicted DNA-binding protein (MmcQ/YjbR family)
MPGDYSEPLDELVTALRAICVALPDAEEQKAWAGVRWTVRKRSFAHVMAVEPERFGGSGEDPAVNVVTFRSSGAELDVLFHAGHPFFRAGYGDDMVVMILDGEVDWEEVGELLTESYCLFAPKKLVALVDRPPEPA